MNTNNFIITTLAAEPNYYNDVIKLIEDEFKYSNEHHFEIDFAQLVDPNNFENCFIIVEQSTKKIVSHIAYTPRVMIKNNIELPIIMIGGIVTHPQYRGQNLFRKLMNHIIEKTQSSAALYFLWSDIQGLYEKFHFYLSGGTIETGKGVITYENIPDFYSKTRFDLISEEDFESIKNLYEKNILKNFFSVKRNSYHWSIIREMKSIDLYIRKENEKIVSYFCVGKGRDLTNIIHELVTGNIESEYEKLSSFRLWLPEYEKKFFTHYDLQFTAFMKLGNIELLNNFLKTISHQKLNIMKREQSFIYFTFDKNDHACSEKDFLSYLFGPTPIKEFEAFHLIPYIAGTDSV